MRQKLFSPKDYSLVCIPFWINGKSIEYAMLATTKNMSRQTNWENARRSSKWMKKRERDEKGNLKSRKAMKMIQNADNFNFFCGTCIGLPYRSTCLFLFLEIFRLHNSSAISVYWSIFLVETESFFFSHKSYTSHVESDDHGTDRTIRNTYLLRFDPFSSLCQINSNRKKNQMTTEKQLRKNVFHVKHQKRTNKVTIREKKVTKQVKEYVVGYIIRRLCV